ncbi:transmembrane protein 59 [Platysternon megacephalum]|uniref:Transmembrane protein 59 n=1 Tax=Platysternon megacephalum TaxID=55544 RepID=A0A4D9EHJ1_9SAUR|nr:transmembrane protein 59 [Platysternon megacephalum]
MSVSGWNLHPKRVRGNGALQGAVKPQGELTSRLFLTLVLIWFMHHELISGFSVERSCFLHPALVCGGGEPYLVKRVCVSTKWLLADELVIHRVRSWFEGQCGIFNLIIICNRNAIIPVWQGIVEQSFDNHCLG